MPIPYRRIPLPLDFFARPHSVALRSLRSGMSGFVADPPLPLLPTSPLIPTRFRCHVLGRLRINPTFYFPRGGYFPIRLHLSLPLLPSPQALFFPATGAVCFLKQPFLFFLRHEPWLREDRRAEMRQFAPGGCFIIGRVNDAFGDGDSSQQVEAGCGLTETRKDICRRTDLLERHLPDASEFPDSSLDLDDRSDIDACEVN